jgi:hypothetical protein
MAWISETSSVLLVPATKILNREVREESREGRKEKESEIAISSRPLRNLGVLGG